MAEPVVLAAVRTPVGRHGGGLSEVRPDDLAAHVVCGALDAAKVGDEHVEEVFLGCANQAGEDNRNVARMAALLAGLPYEVAGVTLNRLCASGLSAVVAACQAIRAGELELAVAGGVESTSRSPLAMGKAARAFGRGHVTSWDTTLGWRFPNDRMAERFPLEPLGETAENVADEYGISRAEQDAFALESQRRRAAADADQRFAAELLPADGLGLDEHPRPDTDLERLTRLKPAFKPDGSVTAGNSSGINDGAAALVIASDERARELELKPLARYVASAAVGVDPRMMGIGPVPAVQRALARAGLTVSDLDLVELNEAFAAQSVACLRELELDPARVNVNGGAIALGHPLGMSGARLTVTLLHELRRRRARFGLVTLCVGVGGDFRASPRGEMSSSAESWLPFVNGRLVPAVGSDVVALIEAGSDRPLAEAVLAGRADIDVAVAAAKDALPAWRASAAQERSRLLHAVADALEQAVEELAEIEARNVGEAIAAAREEVGEAVSVLRFFAGAACAIRGADRPLDATVLGYVLKEPVGVCVLIVPWNYPLLMAVWKVAPSLAAGCTAVLKPDPATPLTALRLAELAGGGRLAGRRAQRRPGRWAQRRAYLPRHPGVKKVAFTGSTRTGREIMRGAADDNKRLTLELGGKSLNLVFGSADLADAVPSSAWSIFTSAGQGCEARSRLLVEREYMTRWFDASGEAAAAIRVDDPLDEATQMGSLISKVHHERVHSFVAGAIDEGAHVTSGGEPAAGPGAFYPATVLGGVAPSSTMAQEEVLALRDAETRTQRRRPAGVRRVARSLSADDRKGHCRRYLSSPPLPRRRDHSALRDARRHHDPDPPRAGAPHRRRAPATRGPALVAAWGRCRAVLKIRSDGRRPRAHPPRRSCSV